MLRGYPSGLFFFALSVHLGFVGFFPIIEIIVKEFIKHLCKELRI